MFAKLETSIKGEMATLHKDLNHILRRVEGREEQLDVQAVTIKDLKEQMVRLQRDQRDAMYRLEDQENRNRRKNLRIRGVPDMQGEDLQVKMDKIFGHLLGLKETEKIKFERVHRVRKPATLAAEISRDIIARFHYFQDKEQIWQSLKNKQPIKYEESILQIFPDLSAETLARRRTLKPLLEHLKLNNIQYSWGFPACLTGRKEGRSATLRYPEDMAIFCDRLNIPLVEIPSWWEAQNNTSTMEEQRWHPIRRKNKRN